MIVASAELICAGLVLLAMGLYVVVAMRIEGAPPDDIDMRRRRR